MINIHQGYTVKMFFRILIALFSLPFLINIVNHPIPGGLVILIVLFAFTFGYGMQIDRVKGLYREYGTLLGIKTGKWKPLEAMPYITIMSSKRGTRTYTTITNSTDVIKTYFDVNFLNENHRIRTTIKSYSNLEEAQTFAAELSGLLNKKVVNYNPPVSAASKARRRTGARR